MFILIKYIHLINNRHKIAHKLESNHNSLSCIITSDDLEKQNWSIPINWGSNIASALNQSYNNGNEAKMHMKARTSLPPLRSNLQNMNLIKNTYNFIEDSPIHQIGNLFAQSQNESWLPNWGITGLTLNLSKEEWDKTISTTSKYK